MTSKEQEDLWVSGISIHNDLNGLNGGECCPDFSCCCPGMKWTEEKRRAFYAGSDETRNKMMMDALKELMDYHEKRRVRIIG